MSYNKITEVILAVRNHFGVTWPCEHRWERRDSKIVTARAIAVLILSRVTDLKLREIAGCVGLSVGAMGNVRQRGREAVQCDSEIAEFVERMSKRS